MIANNLDRPFIAPAYHDHFTVTSDRTDFDDIEHFGRELVLRQPRWLTKISMGVHSHQRLITAIGDGGFPAGSAIGNWQIVQRTDRTITFAEDMRIMAYRLTYTWLNPKTITAETEVRQQSRRIGPLYWRLVTPLHKRFLSQLLRNAVGDTAIVGESTGG